MSTSRHLRLTSLAAAAALTLFAACGDDSESAAGRDGAVAADASVPGSAVATTPSTAAPTSSATATTAATTSTATPATTAPPSTAPPPTAAPATTAAEDVPPAGDPSRVMQVVADDFSFEIVSGGRVDRGIVPITMENRGDEIHQLMVVRLRDGATLDEYLALAHTDEAAAGELIDNAGGINGIGPGATATGYADLTEPGTYVFLCYLPSPDGVGHLHKGMVQQVEVVETDDPVPAPEPIDDVTIIDFNFILPDAGIGRKGTYRFVNEGAEPHEMVIMRINEGKELGDVVGYLQSGFQGEPPVTFEGGVGGVDPGEAGYVDLDLEPGQYLAICFVTSPATHQHHAEMGMFLPFAVN